MKCIYIPDRREKAGYAENRIYKSSCGLDVLQIDDMILKPDFSEWVSNPPKGKCMKCGKEIEIK